MFENETKKMAQVYAQVYGNRDKGGSERMAG